MKNLFRNVFMITWMLFGFSLVNAQTNIPQLINFQAVARDDNNNPIILKPIQIELTIRQGSISGPIVYGAVYEDSTNALGEFSRRLGTTPTFTIPGVSSDFSAIPWESGNLWAVIRFKSSIVGQFKDMGAIQYTALPFAMASKTAEKLKLVGVTPLNGQALMYNGTDWVPGIVKNAENAQKSQRADTASIAVIASDVVTKFPTVKRYTSGIGNYTPSAGVKYIIVEMIGAGGGGGGGGAAGTGGNGTSGGATTFGTNLLTANGGGGGPAAAGGGSSGGTAIVNSPAQVIVMNSGGSAQGGNAGSLTSGGAAAGGVGSASPFGGSGYGAVPGNNGGNAIVNTGSGGGGGSAAGTNAFFAGSGGASGAYIKAMIANPTGNYVYSIGAGGNGGAAGTNGSPGGSGGSGIIIVTEYYY